MAGRICKMINEIIDKKSKGDKVLCNTTKTKLILKGINPDKYNAQSPDDPIIIGKLKTVAKEFGIIM